MTRDEFLAEIEKHEEQLHRIRRNGVKRSVFYCIVTFGIGLGLAQLQPLLTIAGLVVIVGWGAYAVHSMLPRPCVVCGRKGFPRMPLPLHSPYKPQPWWSLMPPPAEDFSWLCADDLFPFMHAQVNANERNDG